ncbi:YcaO-like family protein [uncultured Roseobacter sp.]|uniref:YcaO-like family protein n=1 Tax=uncultured Roseobacter sp. TaxID=114847 RepID=UPI00262B0DF4|nr:YcaO-like family protein [uncultured Roseobacter sp.]
MSGETIPDRTAIPDQSRICPAKETLDRIRPLMKTFGITRLADITGLDRIGLPVMLAVRPNARSISVSQGKGITQEHASASALMEAIEIWHAENVTKPVLYASVADLKSSGFSFAELDRLPATPAGQVPANMRLHWIMAKDLMDGQEKLVPFEMVHADYTHPVASDAGLFPASTNGLASGNHILEAIAHAICEVIERDALSVWHHQPDQLKAATQTDPDTIADTGIRGSIARFEQAGMEVRLWDITSDIRVPSWMCLILDRNDPGAHPGLGSGTHCDPITALHRALNEAAQTRLNYISGAREDLTEDEFSDNGRAARWMAFKGLPASTGAMRIFDAAMGFRADALEATVNWLKQQLGVAGIREIAVVDLSRKEYGIPVVRVIIPGLEAPHDDDLYVPGERALSARGAA